MRACVRPRAAGRRLCDAVEDWWKTESATRGAGSDSPTLTWCANLFRVVNFRQHGCGTQVEGLKGFVSFPQMPSASDEQRQRAPTEEDFGDQNGFLGPLRFPLPRFQKLGSHPPIRALKGTFRGSQANLKSNSLAATSSSASTIPLSPTTPYSSPRPSASTN